MAHFQTNNYFIVLGPFSNFFYSYTPMNYLCQNSSKVRTVTIRSTMSNNVYINY